MNNVLISILLALTLIYISNFLINVKEGMRRSRAERKEARAEKKEARKEKRSEKKEARAEKKEARKEKRSEKKEARKEKRSRKKESMVASKGRNYATSDDQDVLSDQLCKQISKNQFTDDDIDVANLSKVIEELKKEEKINNANKDTLLKYIQHIRVLKLRINNEILYKTKFSDVFNFGDDNDGTDQDIVSVLSNVDSAIKKKTDVINQLNILEKSLIDHYNYHKRLLDKQ